MDQEKHWTLIARKIGGDLEENELTDFNRLLKEDMAFASDYDFACTMWEKAPSLKDKIATHGTGLDAEMLHKLSVELEQQNDPFTIVARLFDKELQEEERLRLLSSAEAGEEFSGLHQDCKRVWENASKVGKACLEQSIAQESRKESSMESMFRKIGEAESEATSLGEQFDSDITNADEAFQKIWALSSTVGEKVAEKRSVDKATEDSAIAAMLAKMGEEETIEQDKSIETSKTAKVVKMVTPRQTAASPNNSKWLYSIAAAVVFLLVAGVVFFQIGGRSDSLGQELAASNYYNLPDGTSIWMEEGGKLEYPTTFEGGERRVRIDGGGFFMVAPDKSKPFVIESNASQTTVTGTSFYLDAKKDSIKGKLHKVILMEGGVNFGSVYDASLFKVVLPGQMASYRYQEGEIVVENVNMDYYRKLLQDALIFKNTPFKMVLKKIGLAFNVGFTIDEEQIGERKFTGSFADKTLEEIFERIEIAMQVEFEKVEQQDNPEDQVPLYRIKAKQQ